MAMPSYSLDLGSSAKSGTAQGGVAGSSGWGSLNQGDWIVQRTGTGDNSAVPTSSRNMTMLAIGAAVAWFMLRRR